MNCDKSKKSFKKIFLGNLGNLGNQEKLKVDFSYIPSDNREVAKEKPSLLLHSCCGPCSTSVIEKLIPKYNITVYFYNPNITKEEEYCKRLLAQEKVIKKINEDPDFDGMVNLIKAPYDRDEFFRVTKGMENLKEGSVRCNECFRLRLQKTAEACSLIKFDMFTTTLSVSPHKDFQAINKIGKELAFYYGIEYLEGNYKKQGGYQRSIEMSKKMGLYRQNYCGCVYSQNE